MELMKTSLDKFYKKVAELNGQSADEANEALYFKTIERYEKEELSAFAKLIGMIMSNAQKAPYGDLLGQFFTDHITKGQNGQYFTPHSICDLMVQMQYKGSGKIKGKTVADPTCGSGRLLLAFAKHHPDNAFYGADNANTCAKMTILNFFVNGLQGEVAWMNTLTMEWYGGWQVNRWSQLGIVPIEKEQSRIYSEPKIVDLDNKDLNDSNSIKGSNGPQLTLF